MSYLRAVLGPLEFLGVDPAGRQRGTPASGPIAPSIPPERVIGAIDPLTRAALRGWDAGLENIAPGGTVTLYK